MPKIATVTADTTCWLTPAAPMSLEAGEYTVVDHDPRRGLLSLEMADDEDVYWLVFADPDDPKIMLG